GAFHEDAFADTCDALGGGWTRERILEIMKDSRLGTYGTMGLFIGVASRAIAMSAITTRGDTLWTLAAIVAAAMISRLVIVLFMATTSPVAGRDSQARDVSGTQSWDRVRLAALIALPLALPWLLFAPVIAGYSLLACAAILVEYRRLVLQRIGGTTGDILGASGFIAQVVVLTGASVA
ncbi:MAG: adenosylcobinamide-GDP ribazoletransferase, partial [Planctomycetota bacterium]